MAWRSKPESGGAAAHDAIENVLGRSCTVRGDLSSEGAFRIDGTVEGSIDSRAAVVVGESGVVRGGVRGTDVVVAGTVMATSSARATSKSWPRAHRRRPQRAQHAHRNRGRFPRDQQHGRFRREGRVPRERGRRSERPSGSPA